MLEETGVPQPQLEEAIKEYVSANPLTAEAVGARPDTWMPTPEEVGARPDTWMPTPEEVGAHPNTWMPTPEEVGAAPKGFGLGGQAVKPPNDSLDDAVANGWYVCGPSYTGAPTGHKHIGYGSVFVINRGGAVIQKYFCTASENIKGYPLQLIRTKSENGTWTPWEWENPPMLLGVEYKTTERFAEKPVYAKRIQYRTAAEIAAVSPSTTVEIDHGIEEFANIVRCVGRRGFYVLPELKSDKSLSVVYVNGASVLVRLINYTLKTTTDYTLSFDLFYTKNT